ncbi:Adenine deaminase [Dissostichus eleginoides]|uniref:Adenine deaminase n=1 Tax=Dissostichus eleginoides TaxID=100907 RepID=A0AAD9BNM0_DISEL|nr:Adenine deaminase [Dissostichus eleginoides]
MPQILAFTGQTPLSKESYPAVSRLGSALLHVKGRYEVTEGVFRRRRLRGDVTRKEWRQTGVFVAQHHLRVELTLMRTLHLTNILLPLSLITALCLSPSQRGTQSCSKKSETQEPRTDLLIPESRNRRHMSALSLHRV